jgi:hypothetical protein
MISKKIVVAYMPAPGQGRLRLSLIRLVFKTLVGVRPINDHPYLNAPTTDLPSKHVGHSSFACLFNKDRNDGDEILKS